MAIVTCEKSNIDVYGDCKNPVIYLLEEAKKFYESSSSMSSFSQALRVILETGLIINECDLCCWRCINGYILTNVQVYKEYYDQVNNPDIPIAIDENLSFGAVEKIVDDKAGNAECCFNFYASVQEYLSLAEAIGGCTDCPPATLPSNNKFSAVESSGSPLLPCCNDFQTCINLFNENAKKCSNLVSSNVDIRDILARPLDRGIVEILPKGVESQICVIYDWLKEYTNDECFANIFYEIVLNEGILISCIGNGSIVFSTPYQFQDI